MVKKFLENQSYAFVIAKIAVAFQSFLTILISVCFVYSFFAGVPHEVLMGLLLADIMFVVTHLSYRAAYAGQKVLLSTPQKKMLLVHALTSLVALGMTGYIVFTKVEVGGILVTTTLCVWGVSLISGIFFFRNKYRV